jgi:hypothetical protein
LAAATFVAILTMASVPSASAASGALVGNVEPAIDTTGRTVSVAASSAPVDGTVAIIIRNGTKHAVDHVKVTAIAGAPGGGQEVRANALAPIPAVIPSGGLALTSAQFDARTLPANPQITFRVRSRATRSTDASALAVSNVRLGPPPSGQSAEQLSMTVGNPGTRTVRGPVTATVMCFGEARTPTTVTTTKPRRTGLRKGASVPVTVDLAYLCPTYLVGARGAASR